MKTEDALLHKVGLVGRMEVTLTQLGFYGSAVGNGSLNAPQTNPKKFDESHRENSSACNSINRAEATLLMNNATILGFALLQFDAEGLEI